MAGAFEYFNSLKIADFAEKAFEQPVGGIFSGVGTQHAVADQGARQQARAAGAPSPESFARARIVPVAAGKVLVRWCQSVCLGNFDAAAGGIWWTSDDIADRIVRETVNTLGPRGDSGQIARVVSAVHHGWSDLGCVVVAKTTIPIRVMVGFGRPVATVVPGTSKSEVLGKGKDLQFMIPAAANRREFLHQVHMCSSTAFTEWWTANNPAAARRAHTIAAARAGETVPTGYPKNVVRTT